jgi:hypothetical protein
MRHAEPQQKMPRQIRILSEQNRRRVTGKTLAVPNQMGLIVVAAGNRRVHPIALWLCEDAKDVVKTLQAAEEFGWETHGCPEAAFQLTSADAKFPRELREIRGSARESDSPNGLVNNHVSGADGVGGGT